MALDNATFLSGIYFKTLILVTVFISARRLQAPSAILFFSVAKFYCFSIPAFIYSVAHFHLSFSFFPDLDGVSPISIVSYCCARCLWPSAWCYWVCPASQSLQLTAIRTTQPQQGVGPNAIAIEEPASESLRFTFDKRQAGRRRHYCWWRLGEGSEGGQGRRAEGVTRVTAVARSERDEAGVWCGHWRRKLWMYWTLGVLRNEEFGGECDIINNFFPPFNLG